jgi:hypothetical protein
VGSSAYSRRAAEAGHPGVGGHGFQVPTAPEEAAVADLAELPGDNPHVGSLVSADFFTVPAVCSHVLFVFVVLAHDRRRIPSINVTSSPSAAWTANQIVQAFPWESAPRYLLRDRDGIYGSFFRHRIRNLGIKEVIIARRSPWQVHTSGA